jgi:hypothetical protein
MQPVPLYVSKPLMSLDIFGIIRIYIAACMVLVLVRGRGLAIRSVSSGTETMVFFLNDASYKVLASLTDNWLLWNAEGGFVILFRD